MLAIVTSPHYFENRSLFPSPLYEKPAFPALHCPFSVRHQLAFASHPNRIIRAGHPLAAGLANGNITVYSTSDGITWGKPNNNAVKIATLTGDAQKIAIFGFEAGVMMDGLAAPARRVGFFLKDDGAGFLTANGILLLNAAITWAANLSIPNVPPSLNITAPISGGTFLRAMTF